jgi:hypothetical protein
MQVDSATDRPLTIERLPGAEAAIAGEMGFAERETAPRTPFASLIYMISWWQHFARRRQMLFHDEFLAMSFEATAVASLRSRH